MYDYQKILRIIRENVFYSYGIAVLLTFCGTLIRFWLTPVLGTVAPFNIYFLTVIITALVAGLLPGIIASALGTLASAYFFIEPINSLTLTNLHDKTATSIFFFEGILISLLINALHIARRRVEGQQRILKLSEDRYKLLLDNIRDHAIFMLDRKGKIISWNPGIEKILGYKEDEFINRNGIIIFTPEDIKAKAPQQELKTALKFGRAEDTRWHVKKDGTRFFTDGSLNVIKDDNGKSIGFIKVFRDITDRQQAQEAQQQKAEILEGITDGFLSFDENWKFTYANHEGARILVKQPEELIDRSLWEEFPELADSPFGKLYKQAMKDKKAKEYEDYYEPLKAWFHVRVYPNHTGLSLYFQNITKRKELERQKDDFLGVASHELKTPVTSIKAYGQVLHNLFKKKGDLKSADLLSKMDAQINKLTALISDLLDVTKIESGKLQLNETTFDFDNLVAQIVNEMQFTTTKHKIIIEGKTHKQICADRDRCGQVLINFLSNAIKYSPHANKIIVRCAVEKKLVKVCVQDFGVGIPKEKQVQIFDRFFRVTGDRQETFPGLGLGLYISAEIIKRQGGTIWVESEKGKGSNFCFSLPVKRAED